MDPHQLIPLLDLTSLNNDDNEQVIQTLCSQAVTAYGEVAAVCVLPAFVKLANTLLVHTNIKIATVSNFPAGNDNLSATLTEIQQAILDGADEIDVVMPYQLYLAGEKKRVFDFLTAYRTACNNICMKVILETGALHHADIIAEASLDAINAGADFIKTSTGKYAIGATLEAADLMLTTICNSNREVGLKVAGGIRTVAQAQSYVQLAQTIMGKGWISGMHFRIGASSLLQSILSTP